MGRAAQAHGMFQRLPDWLTTRFEREATETDEAEQGPDAIQAKAGQLQSQRRED